MCGRLGILGLGRELQRRRVVIGIGTVIFCFGLFLARVYMIRYAALRGSDAEPYLVYADWLQQNGDPRGELITLQHQREVDRENKKLRTAETALIGRHGNYLMPALFGELTGTTSLSDFS